MHWMKPRKSPTADINVSELQTARFELLAQSGSNMQLVIIPLPEQYFQDTCILDIANLPNGQAQIVGHITVREKLHRISFGLKGPDGLGVKARIYVDDYVRQTTDFGVAAFRFASPETKFRVRVDPESPTLVPIDTVMRIPISKDYLSHTFHIKEGRKMRVRVIVDQSDQETQSTVPIPVAGAVVQTLLSVSQSGNSYIQCITNADGVCTLEGVPTSNPTVDVTAWKEDADALFIGKTVAVSTTRPLNPPFDIAIKKLYGITVPDIWGFSTAITDMEIKSMPGGRKDTLFKGFITELPANDQFQSKEDEVRIPYQKIPFKYAGHRSSDGRKIMEPVHNIVHFQQVSEDVVLFDKFDVTMKPRRDQLSDGSPTLSLKKNGANGKMEGTVETELSSFNWSYGYDGKFFLGKTPTQYNIDVFQSGLGLVIEHNNIGNIWQQGQEPQPGPDDFYLLDIGQNNQPQSQSFQVYQFPATSDSSRSFVSEDAFYIHTILHTDILDVEPRDLELSVGKIRVTPEEIYSVDNTFNKLDFKMGKLWRYYSTTPFRYDHNIGGITVEHGFIQTGQVDVPVDNPIIKPNYLIMNEIGSLDRLTLAGIKELELADDVNIVLSKGEHQDIGWMLTVTKSNGNDDMDIVAKLKGDLEPLRPNDEVRIGSIYLHSEDEQMDLTLFGEVRPYDIADLTVNTITTGPGYFILEGDALLGRDDVRVPRLNVSAMAIQYEKAGGQLVGKVVSNYSGTLETIGKVSFTFDQSTSTSTKQYYKDKYFSSTGKIRVYEPGQGEFFVNGILEVKYDKVMLHIIDKDLNIPNLQYTKGDQAIRFGNDNKLMRVRVGNQTTTNNEWDFLHFDANMVNFTGVDSAQTPMSFMVEGPVSASDAGVSVDEIDVGFAKMKITYEFETQSLIGSMSFTPVPSMALGPVIVDQIDAGIRVDPNGFLFDARIFGSYAEVFDANLGMLIGSHSAIPDDAIHNLMYYAENKELPVVLADRELKGFYLTGVVYVFDIVDIEATMPFVPPVTVKLGAEAGFDARFYMDFGTNNTTFGFEALVFAQAFASLSQPGNPLSPCLSATLKLLVRTILSESNGNWDFEGSGCGSFALEGDLGFHVEVAAKMDLIFSTQTGIDASLTLFDECGGG